MPDQPDGPAADLPRFRIKLDYTDEELSAYAAALARRQRALANSHAPDSWTITIVGAVLALVTTFLVLWIGAVNHRQGGVIVVIVFLAFWGGVWSYIVVAGRQTERAARHLRAAEQAEWVGTTLVVGARGVGLRRPDLRAFYPASALSSATREAGLILLWRLQGPPLAIPARLMSAAEQANLIAIAGKRPGQTGPGGQVSQA